MSTILSFLTEGTRRTQQEEGVLCAGSGGCTVCQRRGRKGSLGLCPSHESRTHGPLVTLQPWSALMITDTVLQVPRPHWRPSPLCSPAPSIPGCLLQLSQCRHWVPQVSPHTGAPTCSAHSCTCLLATVCLHPQGLLPAWPVTVDQQTSSPPSGLQLYPLHGDLNPSHEKGTVSYVCLLGYSLSLSSGVPYRVFLHIKMTLKS